MAFSEQGTLRIPAFKGLHQGVDDHQLGMEYSPDCVNIDTREGNLARAKGYEKASAVKPAAEICSLYAHYPQATGSFVVHAGTRKGIYRHQLQGGEEGWALVAGSDQAVREGTQYSFASLRQGYDQDVAEVLFVASDDPSHAMGYIVNGELKRSFTGTPPNAAFLCVCRERLWAAGDPDNPQRIYYSRAFAGDNWKGLQADELPDSAAGFMDLPTDKNQPIVGICRSMDAIFIFTTGSIWTVLGEVPSNFHLVQRSASYGAVCNGAIAEFGGGVYFIDRSGLCYFDGVTAKAHPDAQMFQKTFDRTAANAFYPPKYRLIPYEENLYISIGYDPEHDHTPLVIQYDALRRCAMIRHGIDMTHGTLAEEIPYPFNAGETGLQSRLCFSDGEYIYRYGQGESYDGSPIHAWWTTPWWDGANKSVDKQMETLTAYAQGDADHKLVITTYYDQYHKLRSLRLPAEERLVRLALGGFGKRIKLQFSNRDGKAFRLRGGVEIEMEYDPQ